MNSLYNDAMKRFILSVLILIPILAMAQEAAPIAADPSIVPPDPFTITDVVVDVTGKNAVEARAQAFAKGSEIAVQKFLAAQGAEAGLNGMKPETLVRDFRVDKEQFSRTRYTATLTYRFKPRAMAMLANASLPPEQALPVAEPETLVAAPANDPNAPWSPKPVDTTKSMVRLTSWPLTVRFNEVPEWLHAQSLITARPEIRGYKVMSMSGNTATLEITTEGNPAQIAPVWSSLGWPVSNSGNGLTLDASGMHR